MIAGAAALLVVVLAAFLMARASSRRAAEEEARLAEAARLAEEARIAEEARRPLDETKKAEAKPLAWLEMCDAQQTRHPVRIPSLKIGRGQHNDFVLRNDSVSGNHCVLNCTRDGQWSVTDLNSGNGVIVNGERIQQAELHHGDTVELGELKMRFLLRA
jgi:sRNA-binding protein